MPFLFFIIERTAIGFSGFVLSLYDIKAVAAKVGVSTSTVRVCAHRYHIGRKMGRGWVFTEKTRLRTYIGVWEPISRTGKGPSRALSVSRLHGIRLTPIHRRSLSTVWNSFLAAPTGLEVWPGYAAPIAAIRTSGPSRARPSTSAPRVIKNRIVD
jgi:hypothetical protein